MEQMIAIPIQEFIAGTKLPVDIYIRLGDAKYVLLVKSGDALNIDRASGYEQKKVDFLFVRKEDYSRYLQVSLTVAGIVLTRDEIASKKKIDIIGTTLSAVYKTLDQAGMDLKSMEQTRNVLIATLELVESKKILGDLLAALAGMSDEVLAHSLAVAVVSTGMGHAAGWSQMSTLEKLSLGGLFHDVGMRQLPKDLIKKSFALMDFEELQMYESHVSKGQQIMQSLGFIPEDVLSIISEHHENQAGQGYPKRLKSLRIHPLAKFVALADAFCELILKSTNNPSPKTVTEALMQINHHMAPLFAKDAIRALEQFLYPIVKPKAG